VSTGSSPLAPFSGSPSAKAIGNIFSGDYAAADEGSYFVSTLAPTASTAVAVTTQALADTNPSLAIFNGQPQNGYNLYLRYIKARITAVGGTNTSKNYSALLDYVLSKLTTSGTALGTPQNVNGASGVSSKAQLFGGVNIAAASSGAVRRVGDGQVVGAVEVAFDEWIFDFGSPVMGKNLIGTTTLVSARTIPMPPVIIAPQSWFTLGFWGASQAAAADTIGWEVGFIERPNGQ
jgi:hypothetical protein